MSFIDIKEKIASKLKNKYGENLSLDIEFQYDDYLKYEKLLNLEHEKLLNYSIKVKSIGKEDPDPNDFSLSDIYINIKKREFCVKTENGFVKFPLKRKSVIKLEKKKNTY